MQGGGQNTEGPSLGTAPQLEQSAQNKSPARKNNPKLLQRLFGPTKPSRPPTSMQEVVSILTGKRNEKATARRQEESNKQYAKQEERLQLFDFTGKPELRRQLGRAQHIAKAYLIEKLQRFNVQGIQGLRPRYVREDSIKKNTSGNTSGSGLITVGVIEDNVLETALTAAHELSHGSTGVKRLLLSVKRGLRLAKVSFPLPRVTGDLLENGMAEWDSADIYQRWKTDGTIFDKNDFTSRELFCTSGEFRERVLSQLNGEERISLQKHLTRLDSLSQLGVPISLLESASLSSYDMHEQIGIMWRLSRLLGTTNQSIDRNNDALSEEGRRILEISRYTNNTDAYRLIKQVFGKDARKILNAREHPKNFDAINAALDRAEERVGIKQPSIEH